MTQRQKIQLFEDKKVRVVWDDELQEWFFSVVDAVEVLTDSKDPKDYLKKIRKRDPELDAYVGTNCPLVSMLTPCRSVKIPFSLRSAFVEGSKMRRSSTAVAGEPKASKKQRRKPPRPQAEITVGRDKIEIY